MTEKTAWWQGKKGEWYVFVQVLLFMLVVLGPRTLDGAAWAGLGGLGLVLGVLLLLAGGLLSFWGLVSLGRNLSALPHPLDEAEFVRSGPYNLVRHPIYSGLILAAFGWGLFVNGYLTLAYALVLFLFFDLKTRREEKYLRLKFSEYTQYATEVKKLIPFLY